VDSLRKFAEHLLAELETVFTDKEGLRVRKTLALPDVDDEETPPDRY